MKEKKQDNKRDFALRIQRVMKAKKKGKELYITGEAEFSDQLPG